MTDEQNIISEYKKAIQSYFKGQVIDLDQRLQQVDSYLLRLEDTLQEIGTQIPPFRQSSLAILYVREGSGEKIIGTHRFPFKNRTLMIIPGNTVNSTTYIGKNIGYYLSFNLTFFLQTIFPAHLIIKRRLFTQVLTPFIYLNEREDRRVSGIMETILAEVEKKPKNADEMIALKILEILLICDRLFNTGIEKELAGEPPLYMQYIELIQRNYKDHHRTGYYASQLNVHPNALNAIVKRHSGATAKKTDRVETFNRS